MTPKVGVHGVIEIKDYPYGEFHDRTVDMFDFPCSDTFSEFYQERYGFGGANIEQRRRSQTDGESGGIVGSTSLTSSTRVEETPAPSKLEHLTQESITRSIENRRDLQEHFKHHSYIDKKHLTKKSRYD